MKVLHILAAGQTGGIETLCESYAKYSQNDNIFLFPWISGETAYRMKQAGYKVILLNDSKKNILGPLFFIIKLCKEQKIEAIVEHHTAPVALVYMMFIKFIFPTIKLIMYAHCNADDMVRKSDRKRYKFYKFIVTKAVKRVDLLVAISENVKMSLVNKLNVCQEKITIVYNGVELEKYNHVVKEFHPVPQLIYVGRLIEEKGVQVTLEALSKLPNKLQFRFVIVGDGKYRKTLQRLTKEYSLENKVLFAGKQENVSDYLEKADVFIHMPIWEEGFGITIVEAMAAGLLCICAKSGGISEIIENKKDGYLIETKDGIALKTLLQNILEQRNTNELYKVRVAAQEKAKVFSIEKFANNLDRLIKKKY